MTDKKPESQELKPGKVLVISGKIFKGQTSKEKKETSTKSTCFVPQNLIEKYKLSDKHFVEKSGKK